MLKNKVFMKNNKIKIIKMNKFYNSKHYLKPIEVVNIWWEILVIIIDKLGREIIYTWYDIIEKNTQSIYINKCLLWGFIKKIPKNVLIIWFWWWAFAKYLEDHIKEVEITWIDIDDAMIQIAKKELKVKTNDFYIMDSQKAIKQIIENKNKYELILIDVYWWDWEIPEYFKEIIFFENIKKILSKNWVISINFADYDLNNQVKNDKYNKIHSNLIKVFWKFYSQLSIWKNNLWNIIWIYNLNKFYQASDYDNNYLEMVKNWSIIYDEQIIKNTIVLKNSFSIS